MKPVGTITIKIGGAAGFGIKVAGSTLGRVFSRMGYELFDYTEYPSLIRGGHNTFEITVGTKVRCHTRPVHLLIALNQDTVDKNLSELALDGGLIYEPEKAKLPQISARLFPVSLSKITKEAGGSDLMKNTVALGAALAVLGCPIEGFLAILRETFARKSASVIELNLRAATGGYEAAKELLAEPFTYRLTDQGRKDRMYITGNEAVGLGAIAAGVKAYFAYPMTPSSSLLEFMAKNGTRAGVLVRQPEDEISVLSSAIGAGFAGIRSMVGTSGGGYSLMVEATGLAGITETPVVIFMASRPGPATGLPTWSGQADLRFLMHAAQDEFPRMIIAPGDQEECFYLTAQAFNFADKYQMPAFILSDKNLAEGGKTVASFDQSKVKIERGDWLSAADIGKEGKYLRFRLTPSGVSPRVLPGTEGGMHIANSDEHDEYGYSTEDAGMRKAQMEKRMRKLDAALSETPDPVMYGSKNADLTIISWGSTKGPILQALEGMEGKSVNFLHFTYLWPFPTKGARKIIEKAKKILVVENNFTGQFEGLIRQHIRRTADYNLRKYDGRPFWPHEITDKIESLV